MHTTFRASLLSAAAFFAALLGCSKLPPPLPAPSATRSTLLSGESVALSVQADGDEADDLFWSASPAAGTFEPAQGPKVTFRASPTDVPRTVTISVISRRRLLAGPTQILHIVPRISHLYGKPGDEVTAATLTSAGTLVGAGTAQANIQRVAGMDQGTVGPLRAFAFATDAAGGITWVTELETPTEPTSIAVLPDGSIFVAGTVPSDWATQRPSNEFVWSLSPDGNTRSFHTFGTGGGDEAGQIVASDAGIFLSATESTGAVVRRIDASGQTLWIHPLTGSNAGALAVIGDHVFAAGDDGNTGTLDVLLEENGSQLRTVSLDLAPRRIVPTSDGYVVYGEELSYDRYLERRGLDDSLHWKVKLPTAYSEHFDLVAGLDGSFLLSSGEAFLKVTGSGVLAGTLAGGFTLAGDVEGRLPWAGPTRSQVSGALDISWIKENGDVP